MGFYLLLLLGCLQLCLVHPQRVAPGINPQHYQQQQQPMYQQQQQYQQQGVPQGYQQQQQQGGFQQPQQGGFQQPQGPGFQAQVPVQHQQVPVQHQQVPVQHQQAPIQQQQHMPQGDHHGHHGQPQLLNTANMAHEKEHIAEHLDVPIDTSKMSEQELQFHYFKMHDADNNNKLDGCELIKSLIHWHEQSGPEKQGPPEGKIFKDEELVNLIDPILGVDDFNKDGYIDYPEFVRAQQKAAAGNKPT